MSRFLCLSNDIADGEGKGFVFGSGPTRHAIFLVRKGGEILAYANSCPHRGTPLDWRPNQFLSLDKRYILCATHGALFRFEDGYCFSGPCAGSRLESIPLTKKGDELHINSYLIEH